MSVLKPKKLNVLPQKNRRQRYEEKQARNGIVRCSYYVSESIHRQVLRAKVNGFSANDLLVAGLMSMASVQKRDIQAFIDAANAETN